MKSKKDKKWQPSGNNIQIRYTKYLNDGYIIEHTLTLRPVSLNFQSVTSDEWHGVWENQPVWVKFTKLGWSIEFSDNFPAEHKYAAEEEVRRIERQFN